MSNEDLLMPRYKVIGNYPGCPHSMPIGHILTLNLVFFDLRFHGYTELEPVHLEEPGFDNYPAIFKRLEWWEDREVKDLPKYVKIQERFAEVKNWINQQSGLWLSLRYPEKSFTMGSKFYPQVLPATEKDFILHNQ